MAGKGMNPFAKKGKAPPFGKKEDAMEDKKMMTKKKAKKKK